MGTVVDEAADAPRRSVDGPGPPSRRDFWIGLAAGVVTAAVGGGLWFLANELNEPAAAVVAIGVGVAIGFAVAKGSRGRVSKLLVVAAALLTILANALGQNFAQRSQLLDGIEQLNRDWAGLHVDPPPETERGKEVSAADAASAAEDAGLSCDLIPKGVVVPPPEIVDVMPVGGFLCMQPKDIAVIWADIPAEVRAEFPEDVRGQVEAFIGSQTEEALAARRSEYEATSYDIPDPVVACAPQPDFTQPTAAAGLGFPDGVPLFLPSADLFSGERVRGDGLDLPPASPLCFMRENAKEHPLETASWLAALGLSVAVPLRRRSARPPATLTT